MNDRYLYRAKRTDNGEWVEGFYLPIGERTYIICEAESDCTDGENTDLYATEWYEVVPETVCQYTELTDENVREIFEGDICKDGDNVVRILWNDKHQWGVEILKTDNVLSKGLIFPLWQYDNCKENGYRTLEVIGNIFDNPELLRAGE